MQALVNGESLCRELAEAGEEEQAAKTGLEKVRDGHLVAPLAETRETKQKVGGPSPTYSEGKVLALCCLPCGVLFRKRRFFRMSA